MEDPLEGEADCLAMLSMALASRLPLLLHLDAGSGAARALSLRPMEISHRILYAELIDKGVADADVRGRGGRCVFKLGQGSSDRFYAFETSVSDTMMLPNGLRQVALTCPDKATFRRRRSMRFTPEDQDVQMLALWAAKRMKVGDETDLQKWGKPEFGLAEGKKGPVNVLDISSRGLGLDFIEKSVSDPALLGKGRKFFVHLKIRGFDSSDRSEPGCWPESRRASSPPTISAARSACSSSARPAWTGRGASNGARSRSRAWTASGSGSSGGTWRSAGCASADPRPRSRPERPIPADKPAVARHGRRQAFLSPLPVPGPTSHAGSGSVRTGDAVAEDCPSSLPSG